MTQANYEHLGTLKAQDGTAIRIGLVCPKVEPAATPKPDAVFAGYTREELEEAFNLVKPEGSWKNRIDCTIDLPDEKRKAVEAAIAFYTGSTTIFSARRGGKTRVRADGYYLTIGS